jgi:hypothetical protein
MKTPLQSTTIAGLLAMAALFAGSPSTAGTVPAPVPDGVSAGDWSAIRGLYETGRHAFERGADGSHAARNPRQGWRLTFDGTGFTARPDDGAWLWGLQLQRVNGRPVRQSPGQAAGQRLAYDRGQGVEEWFVNDGRGLEQGWTLRQRPEASGDAPLRLELAVRGGLRPVVSADSVAFADASGATVLTYGGLKAWDATGRQLTARFARNAGGGFALEVADVGAVYPVTIDPVAQQAYIKASNTDGSDIFGYAVSVSGDTLVVGAPYEDSDASGVNGSQSDDTLNSAGAAYVFVRQGGQWRQQAYLKASNPGEEDYFGRSVAVSGDTLVVGAFAEDSNATGVNGDQANDSASSAGAAYVFVRQGTLWRQQAYLKASNTGVGDYFGHSVAVSGDTVVVGAYLEDSSAMGVDGDQSNDAVTNAGAAYVFVRQGTQWRQQAYLKASNTGFDDRFGQSIAVSGDTLVVGAYYEDSGATGVEGDQSSNTAANAGAAYVFVRQGRLWRQQSYLKASNTGTDDFFGTSVAVSGDTVVVGAPGERSNAIGVNGTETDNSLLNAGAAYVFVRQGVLWAQQAYLKPTNTNAGDMFGHVVAVSGDTVVVGADQEDSAAAGIDGNWLDNTAPASGAAYLFFRRGTLWNQRAYLKASNTGAGDFFGTAVAVSGDTLAVGARGEASHDSGINPAGDDNSTPNAGAVYAFGFGASLSSLAKTGAGAPGALDLTFGAPGQAALSNAGMVVFDTGLTGTGASLGRNRGLFSTLAGAGVDLVLQRRDDVSGLGGGYQAGSRVTAFSAPLNNWPPPSGLVLATVGGPGLTAANNRALLRDNGHYLQLVRRTGLPMPELGGVVPNAFREVLQSSSADLVVIHHSLQHGGPVGAGNDSGLLLLNNGGVVLAHNPPREGNVPVGGGVFGQFNGSAAVGPDGSRIGFSVPLLGLGGAARQSLFYIDRAGAVWFRWLQGDRPGSVPEADARFLGFRAVGPILHGLVYRATVTGSPTTGSEGIWLRDQLLLAKGSEFDPIRYPRLKIARFVRCWAVDPGQVVVQVVLTGPGVNRSNQSALLLHQLSGGNQMLLRTGQPAPGIGLNAVTVAAIQAVEVTSIGYYAVTGSLRGAPAAANQALWTGHCAVGNDGSMQELRLPRLCLRKGDPYYTEATPGSRIRSLALKPATDPTGVGGRGLGQVVNNAGQCVLVLMGDGSVREQVLLKP